MQLLLDNFILCYKVTVNINQVDINIVKCSIIEANFLQNMLSNKMVNVHKIKTSLQHL